MKFNKKTVAIMAIPAIFALIAISAGNGDPKGDYKGHIYIAGHGGHIADANIVVDPTDTENPIKIPKYKVWTGEKLHFIPLGNSAEYATHDIRVDSRNRNIGYWSNYTSNNNTLRWGKVDLATNRFIAENSSPLPKDVLDYGATTTKILYCSSAQSNDYFIPIFMGMPGFIDVIDKKTLELKYRVPFTSNPEFPGMYTFTHGASSPDNKYLYLVQNKTTKFFSMDDLPGEQLVYLLDIDALVNEGKLVILQKNEIEMPDFTVTFRATWTPDGKYILQSGMTMTLVINASDLTLKQSIQVEVPDAENHDVVPTPDSKYGIATLRVNMDQGGKKAMDGMIQLYDIENNKWIGKPVSVCKQCHKKRQKHGPLIFGLKIAGCVRCHQSRRNELHITGDNALCGADQNWNTPPVM